MKSFTFRGVRKPWIYMLAGRTKPPFSSINRNMLRIPGRAGAFLRNSHKEPLIINQPIGFKTDDDMDALRLKDELAEWLVTDQEVALQFDDEPGRTYHAVVVNTIEDFERFATFRKGTIQFLCLDPYSYGDIIFHNVTSNPNVANEGTAETYPEIELDIKKFVTEVEITNHSIPGNPTISLGRPASVEQTTYEAEELVFHDRMQSTSSWQQASVVDIGHIAGQMAVDADGFYAGSYGDNITEWNWQGPSLQKGIGTTLTDFKAEISIISNATTVWGTGMMDVYFRDANGNLITKIGFGDFWKEKEENYGRGQVGSFDSGERMEAHHIDDWKDFKGVMRVERIGNVYTFYFAPVDRSGVHGRGRKISYVDNERKYSAPISTIQVEFRKYTQHETRMKQRISEIKIYRINQPQNPSLEIPYIAFPGDIINIDNETSEVLKNGEYADRFTHLSTRFFPLIKGYNQISVNPPDAANVILKYRRKYL